MGGAIPPFWINMSLPIPQDWTETTDGYCWLIAKIPNSPMWRAISRGALHSLSFWYKWDKATGDQDAAAAIASDVFDSLKVRKTLSYELQLIAYRQAALSVTDASLIVFDTIEYDPSDQYDETTGKWTAAQAGAYEIGGSVTFESGSFQAALGCNVNGEARAIGVWTGSVEEPTAKLEAVVHLQPGDVVDWIIIHNDAPNGHSLLELGSINRVWIQRYV